MVEVIQGPLWHVFGTEDEEHPTVKLAGDSEFPVTELTGTVHEITVTIKSYGDAPGFLLEVWGVDRQRAVDRWKHVRSVLNTDRWWESP